MDRAQAQAVAHRGLAELLRVADDVRCVQEPELLQLADRALGPVCRAGTTRPRKRRWWRRTRVSRTAYRRSSGSSIGTGTGSSTGPRKTPGVTVTIPRAGSSPVTKDGKTGLYEPGMVPMK